MSHVLFRGPVLFREHFFTHRPRAIAKWYARRHRELVRKKASRTGTQEGIANWYARRLREVVRKKASRTGTQEGIANWYGARHRRRVRCIGTARFGTVHTQRFERLHRAACLSTPRRRAFGHGVNAELDASAGSCLGTVNTQSLVRRTGWCWAVWIRTAWNNGTARAQAGVLAPCLQRGSCAAQAGVGQCGYAQLGTMAPRGRRRAF